jgi:hypothetical protein
MAEPWIAPDNETTLGVYGVFADDKSNTLWACFSSFPEPNRAPQAPAALKAFDLQTGALKARYLSPPRALSAMTLRSELTARPMSQTPPIVRLLSGSGQLEVWAGNGAFGPSGDILDGISFLGNRLFVNTLSTSKLLAVPIEADGKAGTIAEVKLDRAINRPDGMRSFGSDAC